MLNLIEVKVFTDEHHFKPTKLENMLCKRVEVTNVSIYMLNVKNPALAQQKNSSNAKGFL